MGCLTTWPGLKCPRYMTGDVTHLIAGMTPQVHMEQETQPRSHQAGPSCQLQTPSFSQVLCAIHTSCPIPCQSPTYLQLTPSSRWKTSTARSNGKNQLWLAPYLSAHSKISELFWLPVPDSAAISPFAFWLLHIRSGKFCKGIKLLGTLVGIKMWIASHLPESQETR